MADIVAFDPGVTTGYAIYTDNASKEVTVDEYKGTHLGIWDTLEFYNPKEVVFERFTYQRRTKVELYPVEVIGVIKLWCETNERPFKIQTPSQAKNLWTDEKIRKLGMWIPSLGHGMDALRHLLYYIVVTKGDRTWLNRLKPENL